MLEIVGDVICDVEDVSHAQVLQKGLVLSMNVIAQVQTGLQDFARVCGRYEALGCINKMILTFWGRYTLCGTYNYRDTY
jgi:hypothetical protein